MTRFLTFSAVITLWVMHSNVAQAATEQKATDVFNGRNYLYVEAESYLTFNDTDDIGDGFIEVSKENPIVSDFGDNILPASSNVSGTALLDLPGGQYSHDDSATYEVKFMTAGTYQFVPRLSVFESGLVPSNYGNEDSFFLPPSWNLNSALDWIGYEKEHYDFNDDVELTDPGFALDPLGWGVTQLGDSIHDGRYEILDWGIKSNGVLDFSANDASPNPLRDGNFVWYEKPMMNNYDATNTWVDDFGFRATYEVTPAQVGQVLTFELGARETYAVLDGILFIESPDNDLLDEFTQAEVDAVLPPPIVGLPGDFNDSGFVDGQDFLEWQRDTAVGSLSDWQSNFGMGNTSLSAATAVPEPATWLLLITMGMTVLRVRVS
ncbi:MAG: PEP-CTERM sorting domain-containing protein [Pirellulales bacterium]